MIKKCVICGKEFKRRGRNANLAKTCSFKCVSVYKTGKKLPCKDTETRRQKQRINMLNRNNPIHNPEIKLKRDLK